MKSLNEGAYHKRRIHTGLKTNSDTVTKDTNKQEIKVEESTHFVKIIKMIFVCALSRYKVTQDIPNLLKTYGSKFKPPEYGIKTNPAAKKSHKILSAWNHRTQSTRICCPRNFKNLTLNRVLSVVTPGLFLSEKTSFFQLPPSYIHENIMCIWKEESLFIVRLDRTY